MSPSLLISILLSTISIPLRKSKAFTCLILIFMWILWGWNTYNGDYTTYEILYNNILLSFSFDYEIGYKILMLVGNVFSLSYQQFIQVISLFIVIMWARFIFKSCKYPALFAIIFFWLFFPLDYVLLRNTLAFSIILQAILKLSKKSKNNTIKYCIIVFIATTIHSSCYFYYLFLLYPFVSKLSINQIITYSIIIIIIGLLGKGILQTIMRGNFEGRDTSYAGSYALMIIFGFWEIVVSYILYHLKKRLPENKEQASTFQFLFGLSIILLLLIPIYSMIGIMVRIFRNMLMVFIAYLTNLMLEKKYTQSVCLSIAFLAIFLISTFILPVTQYTTSPLFNNNLFFN